MGFDGYFIEIAYPAIFISNIEVIFTFAAIFLVFILTFIVSIASSVNLEANRSYKLLDSRSLCSSRRSLSVNQRIKVNKNFISDSIN